MVFSHFKKCVPCDLFSHSKSISPLCAEFWLYNLVLFLVFASQVVWAMAPQRPRLSRPRMPVQVDWKGRATRHLQLPGLGLTVLAEQATGVGVGSPRLSGPLQCVPERIGVDLGWGINKAIVWRLCVSSLPPWRNCSPFMAPPSPRRSGAGRPGWGRFLSTFSFTSYVVTECGFPLYALLHSIFSCLIFS